MSGRSLGYTIAAVLMGLMLVIVLAGLAIKGCTTRPTIDTDNRVRQSESATSEELRLALDSLRKLAEGGDQQATQRTIYYFNQWLATEKRGLGDWQPDQLVEKIPRAMRSAPGLERLGELEFKLAVPIPQAAAEALAVPRGLEIDANDLTHLQTNLWLHDIAQRIRLDPPPVLLADWFKAMEKDVGLPESERLAAAERMFDWTIRNIQLDALPPPPKAAAATAGPQSNEPISPALLGEPGPGYRHTPLELLVHGHGDAWERARLFILLCRQLEIDAVMLGLMEETSPIPRGWVAAVPIKDELYLFDPALGLPVPGPDRRGIATLSQVQADPELLRQLDVDGLPYAVSAKEVKNVVALLDADPTSLSRRMLLLEAALPAGSRFKLACEPNRLEPILRKCKGVALVSLWRVPLEVAQFNLGRMRLAAQNPDYARQFDLELAAFDPSQPLLQARNLHIQGRFSASDDEPGARSLYLKARVADREIDALETSEFVRGQMGLQQQLPEDPEQQKAALERAVRIVRNRKHHATYWLGLTYYDEARQASRPQDRDRSYKTAIEWLAERTLPVFPPSPWLAGAKYNLARTYEQLGQWDAAKQWLEADEDSPQRAGNLLRAKLFDDWRQRQDANDADRDPT
jgi:tetratricopeptide (TPR) repeat protein